MNVTSGMAARTAARELARQRRRHAVRHVLARSGTYALAVGSALLCAAPFLWDVIVAFVRRDRWAGVEHVRPPLRSTPFPAFALNALAVGALVTVLTLLFALPAAYALTRLTRGWGRAVVRAAFVVALVPPVLRYPPLPSATGPFGRGDALWSLVLVHPVITIPVAVWLLGAFLRALPADVEEQALVDGHTRLSAFLRVVVPQLAPAIAAVAVLAFTLSAGEFGYARVPASAGFAHGAVPAAAGVVLAAAPLAFAVGLVLACWHRASSPTGPARTRRSTPNGPWPGR
ncbi:hypothetical protein GCM10023196_073630 [Actinoallomurus vinaceus]|uniref:ABC transmembrane type-1 domain-containing protein n=1 Tax=Actinoallomurus vinaceus TaxID=1080074 RepID=A0ABP8UKH2_9ACTN